VSIRIMSNVWAKSLQEGTRLLMLLAIADHANDDGVAYPGIAHLAKKCRVQRRRAMQIVAALIEGGDVSVSYMGGGRGNKKVFQIAPFYLPEGRKGAIGNQKGAIPDAKGEGKYPPTYTESSLSLLNNQDSNKPKSTHAGWWERAFENEFPTMVGKRPPTWWKLSIGHVVSENGNELLYWVGSEKDREYLQARVAKSFERALVGIANRPIKLTFVCD